MGTKMTKKNKDNKKQKPSIPKDFLVMKDIISKFAPSSKQEENKPVEAKSVNNTKRKEKQIDKEDAMLKHTFVDQKEFMDYIDLVIKDNLKAKARSKAKQMDEVFKTLDHIMPEFYQTCMVFGFNALGEKTVYMYAPTEKDKEALFHHVKSTVFNQLGGGAGGI